MNYAQMLGGLITRLILQVPMAVVAVLVFGLRFPTDLSTWLAFIVSALLGFTVMFFFNWFLACFTFYTTEIWGLGVLVDGMTFFLSGALVPLVMMPEWVRNIVLSIPFAQALAVPVGLLTGITPLACGSFPHCSSALPCARSRCREANGNHDPLPEPLLVLPHPASESTDGISRQLHPWRFIDDCMASLQHCRGLDRDAKGAEPQWLEL
jgi:hypothetical protein